MKITSAIAAFILCSHLLHAQADSSLLLKEATDKFKAPGSTPSTVLTDVKFLSIHPLTSFRNVIKLHAVTGPLTIVTANEPGNSIKVIVTIKNQAGEPVPNALIYVYQTDARGWYAADAPHVLSYEGDTRHARLFGYAKTDNKGVFELFTVKPKGYPNSELPAHIHIHVLENGHPEMVTELLFDDDDRLQGEIRERAIRERFLIAKPQKADPPQKQLFSYTIVLDR
ncbi:MAG TPA: hypothetical protein VLJ68_06715 [Chitinophagaceae bacterium]|nr:hypothetical protein [Chitinophagaceae bacterium]